MGASGKDKLSEDTERARLLDLLEARIPGFGTSEIGSMVSLEQLCYVTSSISENCFLAACPGSGKTETVGLKTAYEISDWKNNRTGIAVLSFTRNSAKEIRERIQRHAAIGKSLYPHFAGTIDSWIHGYIFQPFGFSKVRLKNPKNDKAFQIITSDSKSLFLREFQTKISARSTPVCVTEFSKDHKLEIVSNARELATLLEKGKIGSDDLKQLSDKKEKFWRAGFSTYGDGEFLASFVLKKNKALASIIAKRFPLIIVDECQDLSLSQLIIFYQLHKAGAQVHLIGDLDQAIYGFRKVIPDRVAEFAKTINADPLVLTQNYRNDDRIAKILPKVIGSNKEIVGRKYDAVEKPLVLWQFEDKDLPLLSGYFEAKCNEVGINHSKTAIIARGDTLVRKVGGRPTKTENSIEIIANSISDFSGHWRSSTQIDSLLVGFGKAVSRIFYGGKGSEAQCYAPDNISPAKWRTVLVDTLRALQGLYPFLDEKGAPMTWSKWTKNLKESLQTAYPGLPEGKDPWDAAAKKIRAPQGKSKDLVAKPREKVVRKSRLRCTTIHDVKGETLDAVLVVSSNRAGTGGHFSEWFADSRKDEEFGRFAYVAFSRPKYLLILATPKLKGPQLKMLEEVGFENQSFGQLKLESPDTTNP